MQGRRDFCATPIFARSGPSCQKLRELHDNLIEQGQGNYLCSLLAGNDFQKSAFYSTSVSVHSETSLENQDMEPQQKEDEKRLSSIYEKHSYEIDKNIVISEAHLSFVYKHLPFDKVALISVEKATKMQSESKAWHSERTKRIAASNFGRIMNRRKNMYPNSIIKQLLTPSNFTSVACQWGKENEKVALSCYERLKSVKVTACGLIVNTSWPWLGCSPDGLTDDRPIEVKCPYVWREKDIIEACSNKTFFMKLLDGVPKLKVKHNYYYQCQGTVAIMGCSDIDFIVYINNCIFVENIKFDMNAWNTKILPELTAFYFDYIVDKIFEY